MEDESGQPIISTAHLAVTQLKHFAKVESADIVTCEQMCEQDNRHVQTPKPKINLSSDLLIAPIAL